MAILFFTISIALSTPAQKPRGATNKILISLFFLNNSYEINESILKVIFIGLASLTFPHILLEYLLEKNEK